MILMIRTLSAVKVIWLSSLLASGGVSAHHSFSVFYNRDQTVTVTGVVTKFRFTNPHGIIELEVTGKDGEKHLWVAETSAPVYLRRRYGWDRDSIRDGETLTIKGYGATDGSNLLRVIAVTRADGSIVGRPGTGAADNPQSDQELSN